MYLSDKLTVCYLPAIVQDHNLEFLPLSLRFLDHKFCIAVFYRPQVLRLIYILFHSIECIDISQFLYFHLVGNFDVNMSDPSHPLYQKVCNLDSFLLSQVVTGHAHASPTGRDSLIDLGL